MRKLIPCIIIGLFLAVGFFSIDLYYEETATQDALAGLPTAAPTGSIEPEIERVLATTAAFERGSRFAITTNTIIMLDTPDFDTQIPYGEQVSITGHLYEDYDNNGTYDPDVDIPIEDAPVQIFFAGETIDNMAIRNTDENGLFKWDKENYEQNIVGMSEISAHYLGQYTINGTEWFPVNQKLGVNEDGDYYLDISYVYNSISGKWEYNLTGNGKFDPGVPDPGRKYRVGGDVIIADDGDIPGLWDSGDPILSDPLAYNSSDYIINHRTSGMGFSGPLIDEETPDVDGWVRWADDDGDWNWTNDDLGTDGQPGTSDPDGTEGNGRPDPGEPRVDEDINFTYYRKASSTVINVSLWHPAEIDAVVWNSSEKVTDKATVGETINIVGKLKNTIFANKNVGGRAIKFKIFGNSIAGIKRTDGQGNFNFSYTIPTNPGMRVGKRNIDVIFDEAIYDPDYDTNIAKYPSYLTKTSLSLQNEIITLRIYRDTHIIWEYEVTDNPMVGYLYKSISINGTVVDDNNNPLYTTVFHDDGTSEILLLDAYKLKFEWGREVNRYYNYLERDLLDASGNFSIQNYEIKDPFQELGDIRIKMTIDMNASQTYYHSVTEEETVTVRGNTIMQLWIDQDRDTYPDETVKNKKGKWADFITREPFEDDTGKVWNFNNVIVYGRLAISERPDNGINGKDIQYKWEDEDQWYTTLSQPIDIDLNGKFSSDETGMFIIPDPNPLKHDPPKIINPSDPLGPLTLTVRYEEQGGYYDKIEISKDFSIVAMTKIIINPGSGIKGDNVTITGRLIDDSSPANGVPYQNINLYWEDLKGELLEDDKFDPIKLSDASIGNVTTDNNGYFFFYSEEILTRDIDVGQGFVVGIFDGSVPPYTPDDAYIGSNSDEVQFNVSSNTKIKIDAKPQKLIRGKHFTIRGTILETYKGDENPDSKVLLTIADVSRMELYAKNIDQTLETRITNLEVEFKSEGGFTVTGIAPFNLEVGQAQLRLVFNGTKNGRYLRSEIRSFHEVWTETYIKILTPATIEKDDGSGYYLRDDLFQDEYDAQHENFIEPLIFRIQLLEENPIEDADPKPIPDARILFNISGKYSVFTNYSSKFTDSGGFANFSFRRPLTDTDWGYRLPSTQPVELEVILEFTGNIKDEGVSYYEPTKTLPLDTTHHPPTVPGTKPWYDWEEWGWLLWTVVAVVIVFLIVFFFAMRWYTKQQRIKGMRRIIKRAADQLIAGNEYTAVIFKSYQKLGIHLRKYGYLRRESETFREFEDAVRSALPIDRISMDKFLQLLEEARYSTHQIGENQRNDAIRNLRSIERSLDRIIIDEDAALRALERLETEGVKETEILVARGGAKGAPQLLKKPGPTKTKELPKGEPVKTGSSSVE